MIDLRYINSAMGRGSPQFSNPIPAASRLWARLLVGLAGALITLAVLVLLFPLVLAVVVAAIFFMGALIALRFAWKLYVTSRNTAPPRRRVDVIIDPGDSQSG